MNIQSKNETQQGLWSFSDKLVRYIGHVCLGISIRALAEEDELAPSTVSRQCQKIEGNRDEVFYDYFLQSIENTLKNATIHILLKTGKK